MAPLRNHRHEAYAQALIRATKTKMTNGQCYSASGYSATGEAAEAAASRLLCDVKQGVGKRVQQIMEASASRAEVTTASLLCDLDRIMTGAETAEQFAAAKAAVDSKARLKGLFLDKLEVGGPGELSGDLTIEKLSENMINQLGDGDASVALADFDTMIAEVRACLEARAAAHATIAPPPPCPNREAVRALELLLPAPKARR
jgi:hypothetical protein